MKILKRALVLAMAVAMLLPAWSYAEESGEAARKMDVPADEALEEKADVVEPVPEEESGEAEASEEAAPEEDADADEAAQEDADADESAPEDPGTLALDPVSATLDYSQTVTLTAVASAGGDSVTWSSSDESVAAISADSGERITVVGVNAGTATITCASGELTQTCSVMVNVPGTLQITGMEYPSTFRAGQGGWSLRNGTLASTVDLATLTSVIKRQNGEAVGKPYTLSFEQGVRRFDIRGIDNYIPFSKITEAGEYVWTLSATDVCGRSVSLSLPIHAAEDEDTAITGNAGAYSPLIIASEIVLDRTELEMKVGETSALVATVVPGEAVNNTVIWISDDPSVAVVSPAGEVTSVGVGTATVTCSTMDSSGISASCAVTVLGEPEPEPEPEEESEEPAPEEEGAPEAAGRNLILNSGFSGIEDDGIYAFDGDEVTFSASEFGAEPYSFSLGLSDYGLTGIRGSMLALTMEYRIDEPLEFGSTNPWVGFELSVQRDESTGGESQWLDWYGETLIPSAVTDGWVKYSCMGQVSDFDALDSSKITFYFRDTKGTIRFRHPKIEIVDMGWTPAPEDEPPAE